MFALFIFGSSSTDLCSCVGGSVLNALVPVMNIKQRRLPFANASAKKPASMQLRREEQSIMVANIMLYVAL